MKVRELIKLLKKQDPDAIVIFQDHDGDPCDMNGHVDSVCEVDNEELLERLGGNAVALR